jgi:hypothetical protein
MGVTHATAATGTDSGDGKISKNAWNADHVVDPVVPTIINSASLTAVQSQNPGMTITAASSGNRLVLGVFLLRHTLSSVSCTNVTWTSIASKDQGDLHIYIYVGVVSGGSSGTTVTINTSGSDWMNAQIVEIADALTPTQGVHAETSSSGATQYTPLIPGSITPGAGNLVVGAWADSSGVEPETRFIGAPYAVYLNPTAWLGFMALTYGTGTTMWWWTAPTHAATVTAAALITEIT